MVRRLRRHRRGLPLSHYVETYLSEMARDNDYRKMFDPSVDSEIRQVRLNPATIYRSDKLNIYNKVNRKDVENLAWDILFNDHRDGDPVWVGIIDNHKYLISEYRRYKALDFLCKNTDAFGKADPKIPCLVKSMTWDDFDRLSSLIALDSTESKTLTRSQRRNACTNLLTYPHYWILTDIELAKKWSVNHASVNRWRIRARELLRDDDGRISADRKKIMRKWILSRERLLEETDENGNRIIRQLAGEEPRIDPLRKVWPNEARDFTTWLERNIDVLNDAIDLSLSNVRREQAVGDFSVDLVAEDEVGNLVIIENQLAQSDHKHLGQVITYLTVQEAKAAIWIVKEARPEHIKAISWLNESSSASFYLIKIGDSEPLLTVIVDPSMDRQKVAPKKVCS